MNLLATMTLPARRGACCRRGAAVLAAAASVALVPAALAASGSSAPSTSSATSAPAPAETRVETHTDSFELVVQAQGPRLTLYLDRYADNAPVTDARIELDAGGATVAVQPQPDGSYAAQLGASARHAMLPLTVVVTAGDTSDLLAVELPAEGADAASAAAASGAPERAVTPTAVLRGLLVAGVLIGLTALALRALGRRSRNPRKDVA